MAPKSAYSVQVISSPRTRVFTVLLACAAAGLATSAAHAAKPVVPPNYGQYNPYDSLQPAATTKQIPSGYTPVYLENIGRHGARAATDSDEINAALSVFNAAKQAKALTKLGAAFGPDAERVRAVQKRVGAGKLSQLGDLEWTNIGSRSVKANASFWKYAASSKGKIDFVSSTSSRAEQSAEAFRDGALKAASSQRLKPVTTKLVNNNSQLRLSNSMSSAGQRAVDKIEESSATVAAADTALKTLYSASFVNRMSKSQKISAARNTWETIAISPGLTRDGAPDLTRYMPASAADQLAYVNDARAFYKYGPGISGSNASFKKAVVVRDNFFREIDERLFEGGQSVATFRFSHGETTMPFYALLRLNPQATSAKPFTYSSTQWSGNEEAKYATNLEWLVVAKGKPTKAAKSVLVTMRVNERPTRFSAACDSYEVKPYWYDLAGLKKCVARS